MVLSLVILVIIASNVILWNYQMNDLDWERMKENIAITEVASATNSSWFGMEKECDINIGSCINGSYEATKISSDGRCETFREETFTPAIDETWELSLEGVFRIDTKTFPTQHIHGINIQLRYKASDSNESYHLKAYNWTSEEFSNLGFNITGQVPTAEWNSYNVNITRHDTYIHDNGTILVRFHDFGEDEVQTVIEIDFFAVKVLINGTKFIFENNGYLTIHIVSLWVNNLTWHERITIDIFIDYADTVTYIRSDVKTPNKPYNVKIFTERGNSAVFSER